MTRPAGWEWADKIDAAELAHRRRTIRIDPEHWRGPNRRCEALVLYPDDNMLPCGASAVFTVWVDRENRRRDVCTEHAAPYPPPPDET